MMLTSFCDVDLQHTLPKFTVEGPIKNKHYYYTWVNKYNEEYKIILFVVHCVATFGSTIYISLNLEVVTVLHIPISSYWQIYLPELMFYMRLSWSETVCLHYLMFHVRLSRSKTVSLHHLMFFVSYLTINCTHSSSTICKCNSFLQLIERLTVINNSLLYLKLFDEAQQNSTLSDNQLSLQMTLESHLVHHVPEQRRSVC